MSKRRFRMFILTGLAILPLFANAQIRNVATNGTLVKGQMEDTILSLVNEARREAGVSELRLDQSLTNAARQRAVELGSYYNGNHLRPNLNRFNDVLNEFGIKYNASGENIAYGYGISSYTTPEGVFNVWMNSTPHRNNILNEKYDALGIGIFKAPNGYYYWVQNFSDRTYTEYIPSTQHIEDYGNYTLKYEDTIYPNVSYSDISDISLNVGDAKTLDYYINGYNTGSSAEVRFKLLDWKSSDTNIVSINVNKDIVTLNANKAGSCQISTTYGDREIKFTVNVIGNPSIKDSYVLYTLNSDSEEARIDIPASQELSTLFLETSGISRNGVTQFYDDGEIANKSSIDIKYCDNTTCISPKEYVSDNELIADYIQNNFIFNNSGQTTITAIFENGLRVKIPVDVSLFKFEHQEYELQVGEKTSVNIITDMQGNYSFSSMNSDIATINKDGTLSAVKTGIATIRCISDTGVIAYAKVKVKEKSEISINIDEYNIEFVEGEESIIKYSTIPNSAKVSFKSSDERIVTVDQTGKLKGIKPGTATIIVTATSGSKTVVKEVKVNVLQKKIPATDIALEKTKVNLTVGDSYLIKASLIPNDSTDKLLNFKSSNEMVAVVDSNGKVTGLKAGNAVITVTAGNGVSKEVAVSVTEKVHETTDISVDTKRVELSIGESYTLKVTVAKDKELTMYSDNPSIATIDKDGKITAISNGSATIHITTDKENEVLVEVIVKKEIPITSITLDKNNITLTEGKTSQINATINPENTTDILDLVWTSNNNDVATVDNNGKITAIKEGTAIITVMSVNGVQANITVKVTKTRIPISSIEVNLDNIELYENESIKVDIKFNPENTTDSKTLTWKSNNTGIAIVDNNGKITAIHEGSTIITVTTTNGINHEIKVLVKKKIIPITNIELDKNEVVLEEDEFTSIKATVYPNNTTDSKTLSWKSSNMSVATVDNNGKITAVKKGNAIITVTSVNGVSKTINVTVKEKRVPISSIKVDKKSMTLYIGDTSKINATIYPTNTTDSKTLTWKSSNPDILRIDNNGTIQAIKSGRSTVTVASVNGITAEVIVTVLDTKLDEIHLNLHEVEITDKSTRLDIESYSPNDISINLDLVEWSSSNPSVAVIINNKIIPIGYGETFITARYGDVSDTCRVVVPIKHLGNLGQLYDNNGTYKDNEFVNVLANTSNVLGIKIDSEIQELLDLYDDFRISWESSDDSVIAITDGIVRFKKPGSATIKVSLLGYSTTLNYNVYDIDASISSNTIKVGETTKVNANILSPTTNSNPIYRVSDTNIATINKDGLVTGINPGKVTIYIYSSDGKVYVPINLTVLEKDAIKNEFDVVFDKKDVVLENENGKVTLSYKDITKSLSEKYKDKLVNSNEELISYFKIVEDNDSFENKTYNISIPISINKDYEKIYLLYIKDGKVLEKIPSNIKAGYINFKTNNTGEFAVVGKKKYKDNNSNIKNPNTSPENEIIKYIISWITSFIILCLLTTTLIRKRMN